MSHFTVTVALDGTLTEDQIEGALAEALAPYDENVTVDRYVQKTKAQIIADGRESMEVTLEGAYADFVKDPAAYAAKTSNLRHLEYLAGGTEAMKTHPLIAARHAELLAMVVTRQQRDPVTSIGSRAYEPMPYEDSFPAKMNWTDEQFYADAMQWEEPENIAPEGGVYSTYNPKSKWDWYSVGGRWANYWAVNDAADKVAAVETYDAMQAFADTLNAVRPGAGSAEQEYVNTRADRPGKWVDVARKFDIDFDATGGEYSAATYAFLDSSGGWHEKGEMGWFGMSRGDKEQDAWDKEYAALVKAEADNAWFVLVDCHI